MSKFSIEWTNLPECLNLKSIVEEYENVDLIKSLLQETDNEKEETE